MTVVVALCISWLLCLALTKTNTLPSAPTAYGYLARTDTKGEILSQAPWFRFPYPVELSCSESSIPAVVPSFTSGSIIVFTVFVIIVSYMYILITILKMRSKEGRRKAFSTCSSHLTAVTLFYGTLTFTYVMPKSIYSTEQNKVVSVFYTVVIPMLNPIIYSLRNNDIKGALKRVLHKIIFS
ncbi:Olfactory receptor 482 [Myotis brandtii]|uniref:Olfactory receptor 482 n=1 Tax=Myotis brandtii TaxID=109478 RepID=S7N5T0_MYOBR|nr:Olfactory receptor 482 [Myotis brandtii]